MNIAKIIVQEDQWIPSLSQTVPEDKELCIVITDYDGKMPKIMQYRNPDYFCNAYQDGYFLDVGEGVNREELGLPTGNWTPKTCSMRVIKKWKVLVLPGDDKDRIREHIERWLL